MPLCAARLIHVRNKMEPSTLGAINFAREWLLAPCPQTLRPRPACGLVPGPGSLPRSAPMTTQTPGFEAWRAREPGEAADLVLAGVARLSPAQARAVFAVVPDREALAGAFAAARRDGPLGGVPFVLKDLFDVAGLPTRAGSVFLPEVRPTPAVDSALVRALGAAGAVMAAKTHLHEFAYGLTGENAHFGDCEVPGHPGRTTGGSSSGSAAAVAAGIVPLGIGTDTGGSIRVPAAFCGLFGLRLTPRHPWIADAFPLVPGFDTAGWFTATAGDMGDAMDALLGPALPGPAPRGCWLELPGMDPDVAAGFCAAAACLAPEAAPAHRLRLLRAFEAVADTYVVLGGSESRVVHAAWADRYADRYDPLVRGRLEAARRLTDADIAAAGERRRIVLDAWEEVLRDHDFVLLPATPCRALTKAGCTPANRMRLLGLTAPASLAGLPVLTIPVPLSPGPGTGIQVVARSAEGPVLRAILRAC